MSLKTVRQNSKLIPMKAVIQKSGPAKVEIKEEIHGEISGGLVILLGITQTDTSKNVDALVDKILNLRIFEEGEKYFEKSVLELKKEILVISQFTLYADCRKGRRPDFNNAAKGDIAKPLYEEFIEKLRASGLRVATGEFGAMMKVSLSNEGPVTIILEQ